MKIEDCNCIWDGKTHLGEGVIWSPLDASLYWADFFSQKVYWMNLDVGVVRDWTPPMAVGSMVPRRQGGLIAACTEGVAFIDPDSGYFELVVRPEPQRPKNHYCDAGVDRSGNFWTGSWHKDDSAHNPSDATVAFYRVTPGLDCRRIDDGYFVTNGPVFSLDGKIMYHTDSLLSKIYRSELAADGTIIERSVFHEAPGQVPDGMVVDAEDTVWVAMWRSSCLRRLSKEGEIMDECPMPVTQPTKPVFGGRNMDRLFVISASLFFDDDQRAREPLAGGLFEISNSGAKGVPDEFFLG